MSVRLILAIALTALIGLAAGMEEENESIALSSPSSGELAIRYLEAPSFGETELQKVQLLPGMLPEQMPVQLPLPRGSKVFGSVLIGGTEIGVVVDSPLTAEEVMAFYRQALATQNWTAMDVSGMERGFMEWSNGSFFCQGSNDTSIAITAYPRENGSDIRVGISTDPECSPCSFWGSDDWLKPIPKLVAPKNATLSNQNFVGGCGNQVMASADVKTESNSSALAAHFADQLIAANWTSTSQEESGPAAWSTWEFEDEEGLIWDGFLTVLEVAGSEDRRFVMMQASQGKGCPL